MPESKNRTAVLSGVHLQSCQSQGNGKEMRSHKMSKRDAVRWMQDHEINATRQGLIVLSIISNNNPMSFPSCIYKQLRKGEYLPMKWWNTPGKWAATTATGLQLTQYVVLTALTFRERFIHLMSIVAISKLISSCRSITTWLPSSPN